MKDQSFSNRAGGLTISTSEPINSFLRSASGDLNLTPPLRQTASSLSSQLSVPYKSLRSIWVASYPSTRPETIHLFAGSEFVFNSPKPREKCEELKVRLRKLEQVAERNAYEELVKDITPRKNLNEPFSSYKNQLGFGLHVVLTLFTGFLVGYAGIQSLVWPESCYECCWRHHWIGMRYALRNTSFHH